jgi:hypothetical protein
VRRAILMVVATMSLLGTNAMADDFVFSINGGFGTVTGEIIGLQNNATGSATEVVITSYPTSFGSILNLIATDWTDQLANIFTVTNGAITEAEFFALDTDDANTPQLLFLPPDVGQLQNNLDVLLGPLTFAATPVPEPFAWVLLLTVMLAVAIVKRSRRTDGLNDPATRMKS